MDSDEAEKIKRDSMYKHYEAGREILRAQQEINDYEARKRLDLPRDVPATRTEGFRKDRS